MKKMYLVLILLISFSCYAFGDKTGGSFSIGNNNLTEKPMTSTTFAGTEFPWGASVYWLKEANEQSGIEVGFTIDPIMRKLGYTRFYFTEDIFSLEVGPFFGLLNSAESLIKSGIATKVRVNIPGIVFTEFSTASTIGGTLVNNGDYLQESNKLAAGFYVYNAICTAHLDTRRYSRKDATLGTVVEDFAEYAFIVDLFQKNVPYNVEVKLAYQTKLRTINTTNKQSLNNVILGTDIKLTPLEFLEIYFGVDSSVYSFGIKEDTAAGTKELLTFSSTFPGNYLFNAEVGFTLDLDTLLNL